MPEIGIWLAVVTDSLRVKKRRMIFRLRDTVFPKSKSDLFEKAEDVIREAGYFVRIGSGRYGIRDFQLQLWKQRPVARYGGDRMVHFEVRNGEISLVSYWDTSDELIREIKRETLYSDRFQDRPRLFSGRTELFQYYGGELVASPSDHWSWKPDFAIPKNVQTKEEDEIRDFPIPERTSGFGVPLGHLSGFGGVIDDTRLKGARITKEKPRD